MELRSNTLSGNQWYVGGVKIDGGVGSVYVASQTGLYSVVVTDGNGCSSAVSVGVSVLVNALPSSPVVSAQGMTEVCVGGNVSLSSSVGSGNQWYVGGVKIDGAVGRVYVASQTGLYSVRVTDGNGCTSEWSNTVTVTINALPAAPVLLAQGSTEFCDGGSVVLGVVGSGVSYRWYSGGSVLSGVIGSVYTVTVGGSYSVRVTDVKGCESELSSSTVVVVNALPVRPVITAQSATTFCDGGSVELRSNTLNGNQWYVDGVKIDGAVGSVYVASQTGLYSVVVTDVKGCSSVMSVGVSVLVNALPLRPVITAQGATTFCDGGSVVLSSSSGSGNQWYRGVEKILGAVGVTYSASESGVYSVRATDVKGC